MQGQYPRYCRADRKLACKQGHPRQTRRPFLRPFRRELSFLLPISGPQPIDNICFDLLTMTPNTVVTVGARLDYKPVHLRPLSNEVKTIPPKERAAETLGTSAQAISH